MSKVVEVVYLHDSYWSRKLGLSIPSNVLTFEVSELI
jgi:hypothetical protein